MCGDAEKMSISPNTKSTGALIWVFLSSSNMRNAFVFISHPVCGILVEPEEMKIVPNDKIILHCYQLSKHSFEIALQ